MFLLPIEKYPRKRKEQDQGKQVLPAKLRKKSNQLSFEIKERSDIVVPEEIFMEPVITPELVTNFNPDEDMYV
jgi:hypothetical protein